MGTVLVADDDEDTRVGLDELLVDAGFSVVQAADGHEALASLERGPTPNLALIDAHMPSMGGAELLKRIRAHARLAALPVVVYTGDRRFSADGATEIVQKPFDVDKLLELIRRHCR